MVVVVVVMVVIVVEGTAIVVTEIDIREATVGAMVDFINNMEEALLVNVQHH
jgi:hypothetical protein